MKGRPDHFIEKIDIAYANVGRLMKKGYVWTGSPNYSFEYGEETVLNTQSILDNAATHRDLTGTSS